MQNNKQILLTEWTQGLGFKSQHDLVATIMVCKEGILQTACISLLNQTKRRKKESPIACQLYFAALQAAHDHTVAE